MKVYEVQQLADADSMLSIPRVAIEEAPWGASYRPRCEAAIAIVDDGIEGLLIACEENPRSVETLPNAEVYEDSCLEFFLIPFPAVSGAYLNFEFNSLGTLLLGYGPTPEQRVRLPEAEGSHFTIRPIRLEEGKAWGIRFHIPFVFLESLYGVRGMPAGHTFRGNFQKCGDRCTDPHYLTWNPIDAPGPDFHRPECFGTFHVGEGPV